MSYPVSSRVNEERLIVAASPADPTIRRLAGSRVWTIRLFAGSKAIAIGCCWERDWPGETGVPHWVNSKIVERLGVKALPGATAAKRDPSIDTATSTGSTPENSVLTVIVPLAVRTVRRPRTAPLSGAQPRGRGGGESSTPPPNPDVPPAAPTPRVPAKQFGVASASTPAPASSDVTPPSTASPGPPSSASAMRGNDSPPMRHPPPPAPPYPP